MAKTVWGLELGTSSIKAVKMLPGKDALEILAVDVIDLPAQDEDIEESHEDRLRGALTEFKGKHKVGAEAIWISIPGHQTFNRLISLPYLDPKKFAETVKFEAQQQMPVKMDDIIWDYQMVDKNPQPGEDTQVSLFAVRKEIIDSYLALMSSAGLQVSGIQVAPLAIYNFIKYDQRKFGKSGIVCDIGADNTDLVIIDENKVWIRNVPSGGSAITKTLQERFKIPYEEAEKLKIKAAKSQQAQKIFGVMKPALRELLGEIHRSVGFYKSQHPGVKLGNMLLMGSGAHLMGLKKFFEQNLQYPVDKLTHLNRLQLAKSADPAALQNNIATMAVALGLAVQGSEEGANTINLIPESAKSQIEAGKKFLPVLAASVATALFPLMLFIHAGANAGVKQATGQQATVQARIATLSSQNQQATQVTDVRAELSRYDSMFATRGTGGGVFPGGNLNDLADEAFRRLLADRELIDEIQRFNTAFRPFGAVEMQPKLDAQGRAVLDDQGKQVMVPVHTQWDLADTADPRGYIDANEFAEYVRSQNVFNFKEGTIKFSEIDRNGDQYISWYEARPRSQPKLVEVSSADGFPKLTTNIKSGQWYEDEDYGVARVSAYDAVANPELAKERFFWARGASFRAKMIFAIPVDLPEFNSEWKEYTDFRNVTMSRVVTERLRAIVVELIGQQPITTTVLIDEDRQIKARLIPASELSSDGSGNGSYFRVSVGVALQYFPPDRGRIRSVGADKIVVRFPAGVTLNEQTPTGLPRWSFRVPTGLDKYVTLNYMGPGPAIPAGDYQFGARFTDHNFALDAAVAADANLAAQVKTGMDVFRVPTN